MKKFYIILLTTALFINTSNAKIYRVGFTATNPIAGVDYLSLQAAHDAAAINDTIQIYPTMPSTTYSCNVTKKLNFIGTGYMTDGGYNFNPSLQYITGASSVNLNLDAGSSGSMLQGLGNNKMISNGNYTADGLSISVVQFAAVNNITIKRCTVIKAQMANYAPNDSWTFVQCYFIGGGAADIYAYPISNAIPTNGGNAITNLRIDNCIFAGGQIINLSNAQATGCTGEMVNNVLVGYSANLDFNNAAFLVQNNICPLGNNFFNATNCTFQNNVTTASSVNNAMNNANSSNNKFSVPYYTNGGATTTYNTLFVGYPYNVDNSNNTVYSEDTRYQLKAGSAALGAGLSGVDCGAFGGSAPYKLSGIPVTPSFYKISSTSSTTSTSPYVITFSVRSNN